TALTGAPFESKGAGAAWVFARAGSTWSQQGPKLAGRGATAGGRFGWRVAVSGGGHTAIVGGPYDGNEAGAAPSFTPARGRRRQQGPRLTGGAAPSQSQFRFGWSVALSADGNTALVGAPMDGFIGLTGGGSGTAWVFTRSGSTWTRHGTKLTGGSPKSPTAFGN